MVGRKAGVFIASLAALFASAQAATFTSVVQAEGQVALGHFGGDPDFFDFKAFAVQFTVTSAGVFTFDVLANETPTSEVIGPSTTQNLIDVRLEIYGADGTFIGRNDGADEFFGDGGVDGIDSPTNSDPFVNFSLVEGDYYAVIQNTLGATTDILDTNFTVFDFRKGIEPDDSDFGFQLDRATGLEIAGSSADVMLSIGVTGSGNPGAVELTQPIPVPASWLLVSGPALLMIRKRRAKELARD